MIKVSKAKFFVAAQQDGHYSGSIILPSGTKYTGRIYANKGPSGDWYRGDLMAADAGRFNEDSRIDASAKPEGLSDKSTLKPLELRLNPWTNGNADLIGNLWTSEGLFVVFANAITHQGRPALAGNIKPQLPKAANNEPDAGAARDGAKQRVATPAKPPKAERA